MYSFHRKINNASSLSKWICFNLLFESEYRYTVHWVCISSTLHRLCIYRYNKQRSVYCLDSYYADVLLNTINIEYKNWKKLINYLWLFPITFHYNRKVLCNINKGNNGTGGVCFFTNFEGELVPGNCLNYIESFDFTIIMQFIVNLWLQEHVIKSQCLNTFHAIKFCNMF